MNNAGNIGFVFIKGACNHQLGVTWSSLDSIVAVTLNNHKFRNIHCSRLMLRLTLVKFQIRMIIELATCLVHPAYLKNDIPQQINCIHKSAAVVPLW